MLVANGVEERHEDVEAGVERGGVLAEALDDPRVLLRHDASDARDHDHQENDDDDCYEKTRHGSSVDCSRRAYVDRQPDDLFDDAALTFCKRRLSNIERGPTASPHFRFSFG